jgi:hypothetical protein
MMRNRFTQATGLVLCVLSLSPLSPAQSRREAAPPSSARGATDTEEIRGNVVLNERAYWRSWLHGGPMKINPQALQEEADALFKKDAWDTFRQRLQAALKKQGGPPEDWYKEVLYDSPYQNLKELNKVRTSLPPADWMAPAFDDSDWCRYQKPYGTFKDFKGDGIEDHFYEIKTHCLRTTFDIPDPARTGDLALRLVYRGGVRVFFNGSRSHAGTCRRATSRPTRWPSPIRPRRTC